MNKKLAIIGSRTFDNFEFLESQVLQLFKISEITEIISGGAKGTDSLAEKFADKYKIKKTIFIAEWEKFGKSAGMKRNKLIIKNISSKTSIGNLID